MKVKQLGQRLMKRGRTIVAMAASIGTIVVVGAFQATPSLPASAPASGNVARAPKCDASNGGLTLPAGFCASVFADSLGKPRHMAITPSGDVFIARHINRAGLTEGGVVVLRDSDGDGKADKQQAFGPYGGGGIAFRGNYLYLDARVDSRSVILRYTIPKGEMVPTGAPDTIVSGLPVGGNHFSRDLALDGKGNLFVNVGSATNVCQATRTLTAPGVDPCVELETRAGIWKFSDSEIGQKFSTAARYVTGLRNGTGLAWNSRDNSLYATQHGRDALTQAFPKLYDAKKSAENPAEELMKLQAGDDFGWPYCYYDIDLKRRVLAPEYGGDATMPGRCTTKQLPVVAFPGHWAPNDVAFYSGSKFPAKYRDGAFVAFHGSWNRNPEPQAGYRVVFAPSKSNKFAGTYETFADGFAGLGDSDRTQGKHRPAGLATMPDGSLLISDDKGGRVWKVVYGN